jgi:dipeptidyl aminopeptidase/acylaminoacyl peptidase
MADNRRIMFATREALWIVNIDDPSHAEKISAGSFAGLSLDRTGQKIAFMRSLSDANIWRVGRDGKDPARLIASSGEDSAPNFSPDGKRIVVRSNRSGAFELYTYASDGSDEEQITNFGAHIDNPTWSPDGEWIAFDGNRAPIDSSVKHHNIYLVPSRGGPVRRITNDAVHYEQPSWSHDGRWIYYLKEGNPEETWKVPFSGGEPILVDPQPMLDLVESSDGAFLYFVRYNYAAGIRRRRIADGKDQILPGTEGVQVFRYWSLARDGIFFVPGPPDTTLRFLDFRSSRISTVIKLSSNLVKGPRGLTVSPDGRWIFYTVDDLAASDIMLATIQ